ncbi:hypothetical protein COCVIDRAFT_104219 [Bipolaris victoriae FI3]|uniref:Uncharacterized protein n=1 Tax=Bipolaris victoriae (strain FI3) TaxID=930091 RepID=W7E400_BIPV3|nr:hypothetical protein COCVIDRAFT_104219 [Bipolaris victoriae FI3]
MAPLLVGPPSPALLLPLQLLLAGRQPQLKLPRRAPRRALSSPPQPPPPAPAL